VTNKRLLVICNAIDDKTREERKIVTDSPAASKKMFLMCRALSAIGVDVEIISLGRGSVRFGDKCYPSTNKIISSVPICYLPFNGVPLLSHLVTLLFATLSVFNYSRYNGQTAIIFYNRMPLYVGALFISKLLGYKRVLDLEDGETKLGIIPTLTKYIYDNYCNQGAILACSTLDVMTSCRPVHLYYGVNYGSFSNKAWTAKKIRFLFSGTITIETGAQLLIETIETLRYQSLSWTNAIEFIVTGKGDLIDRFTELQLEHKSPSVQVLGRLSNNEYSKVIYDTHVGLALKPNGGLYANTTFPSKVVEFASNSILVISTNISDVKKVLGSSGALYLDSNSPDELIQTLKWVVDNKTKAGSISKIGNNNINYNTNPNSTADKLSDFIFK
jgi:glycosyltransferase involved in cell wall biosynthesis